VVAAGVEPAAVEFELPSEATEPHVAEYPCSLFSGLSVGVFTTETIVELDGCANSTQISMDGMLLSAHH